ncbi:hypothetical protein [Salinicola sp. CR57]|uniref:hypothetical protein n=1 Tax=Salinicola sp. CR57 TaxID=1949086 RepID=UPI001E309885|nr:hypothetical protein [Salinicola sp. CR57]
MAVQACRGELAFQPRPHFDDDMLGYFLPAQRGSRQMEFASREPRRYPGTRANHDPLTIGRNVSLYLPFDPKRLARLETTPHIDRSADPAAFREGGRLPWKRLACAWGGSGMLEQ